MRAKFKHVQTAINKRNAALEEIFSQSEFLLRLSKNHPDVIPEIHQETLKKISLAVIGMSK